MAKKVDSHLFTGMRRDVTISAQDGKFLRDARNIRLTARDNETFLAITNEKGPAEIVDNDGNEITFDGVFLGYCVITDYLVVFTHRSYISPIPEERTVVNVDTIYRVSKYEDENGNTAYRNIILYSGDLNFDLDHPIETLASVESASVQKVYWVDGKNQPRVINVTKDILLGDAVETDPSTGDPINMYNPDSFDFVQKMSLREEVRIKKNYDSAGFFPAGVLQYVFTYFNKYGQESNIFYTSPLIYTSYQDRAGSPEDNIYNSFTITINKLDQGFDYVRVYSIMRTSLDAVPAVKIIKDIQVPKTEGGLIDTSITFTDTNTEGANTDPTLLLYVGGTPTAFETFAAKDNTLFLGNYSVKSTPVDKEYKIQAKDNYTSSHTTKTVYLKSDSKFYNTLSAVENILHSDGPTEEEDLTINNLTDPRGFKGGETYRFGFQLQDNFGKWSEPIYLGDEEIFGKPEAFYNSTTGYTELNMPVVDINIPLTDEIKSKYKRVRGLVVYPSIFERKIVTQGLACPTVYNLRERQQGTIHNQASWFLRVNPGKEDGFNSSAVAQKEAREVRIFGGMYKLNGSIYETIKDLKRGYRFITDAIADPMSTPQFKHNYTLCSDTYRAGEIQGILKEFGNKEVNSNNYITDNEGTEITSYESIVRVGDDNYLYYEGSQAESENNQKSKEIKEEQYHSVFAVDQEVINILSPEVEFENLQNVTNVNIAVVGKSIFTKTTGKYEIEVSTPAVGFQKDGTGFDDITLESDVFGSSAVISGLFWKDYLVAYNPNLKIGVPWWEQATYFRFMIYPWQAITSLCADSNTSEVTADKYALLRKKLLYNYKYASSTIWNSVIENKGRNTNATIVYEDQQQLIRYQKPGINNDYINYYNTIDTALTTIGPCYPVFAVSSDMGSRPGGRKAPRSYLGSTPPRLESVNLYGGLFGGPRNDNSKQDTGPIRVPIVIDGRDYHPDVDGDGYLFVNYWESLVGWNGNGGYAENLRCWQQSGAIRMKYKTAPHILTYLNSNPLDTEDSRFSESFLSLVEVQRNEPSDFGGTSAEALKQNLWLPAGPSKLLGDEDNITINFIWGDTWYQRYEHLKCYQFAPDDTQSIVEIGSFLCESRENIDGRYDRNKGPLTNKYVNPENFNLINKVYSQQNNFFTYRIFDDYFYNTINFPNTLTWTKAKQPVADIDLWTNITLASNLYLDDAHPITALKLFNDNIYAFQRSGIYRILFNSRVQIPTSDGIPVEISNNYKVDGKATVSDSHGCNNKYEIVVGGQGLYFRDYTTKEFFVIGGNSQTGSISDSRGFSTWFKSEAVEPWRPAEMTGENQKGCKLYYDKYFSDVYIAKAKECLTYSEKSGEFVSFLDYNKTGAMFNIGPDFYCITWEAIKQSVIGITATSKLWKMFDGKYNNFFGTYKPFYFTFISNQEPTLDKIFTNLEYRADFYLNKNLLHNKTFDYVRAITEYQDTEETSLLNKRAIKKFRIWRVDMPRHKNTRDRIRNTWCKITLGMNAETNDYSNVELHDLQTIYYT